MLFGLRSCCHDNVILHPLLYVVERGRPCHSHRPLTGLFAEMHPCRARLGPAHEDYSFAGEKWGGLRVALERVMTTSNKFGIFPVFRGLDGKLIVQKEVPFSSEEESSTRRTYLRRGVGRCGRISPRERS
jgi:hypothetical protein